MEKNPDSSIDVRNGHSLSCGEDKTHPKQEITQKTAVIGCPPRNQNKIFSYEAFHKAIHPKRIRNMISGASSDDISTPVMESDPVYKTYKPIEKCPICEIDLVPEQFTVNIVTAVMKTSCQCGFAIEIIITPSHLKVDDVQKKRKRCKTNNNTLRRLRPRL